MVSFYVRNIGNAQRTRRAFDVLRSCDPADKRYHVFGTDAAPGHGFITPPKRCPRRRLLSHKHPHREQMWIYAQIFFIIELPLYMIDFDLLSDIIIASTNNISSTVISDIYYPKRKCDRMSFCMEKYISNANFEDTGFSYTICQLISGKHIGDGDTFIA